MKNTQQGSRFPSIEIPISPISCNTAWKGKKFKTPQYKKWREDFALLVPKGKVEGWLKLRLCFFIKNFAMRDLDNMIKTTIDALVENGIIHDDRNILWLDARKYKVNKIEQECITVDFE